MPEDIMDDTIKIKKTRGVIIIYLSGRLDLNSSHFIEMGIKDILKDDKSSHILLNLANVDFIVSSTLHMFMTIKNELKKMNKNLMLCNINEQIENVLKVVDLINTFEIYSTEEEALAVI